MSNPTLTENYVEDKNVSIEISSATGSNPTVTQHYIENINGNIFYEKLLKKFDLNNNVKLVKDSTIDELVYLVYKVFQSILVKINLSR